MNVYEMNDKNISYFFYFIFFFIENNRNLYIKKY